jgi:integrase
MSIRWDSRNKRWRFEFDRVIGGRRFRPSRLLPKGWTQAQADAYDVKEVARLYALATGVQQRDPLISEAVLLYLQDKAHLKSHRAATEHLHAIAWAYTDRRMSELAKVTQDVITRRTVKAVEGGLGEHTISLSTARNRLALLKAAARWGWKKHQLVDHDPTAQMQLPSVNNARQTYIDRKQMLQGCRACTSWATQIAIRVAFYTGLRLSEIQRAEPQGGVLLLRDSKNGDMRAVPIHPRIKHLVRHLPLQVKKRTIQKAWERARAKVGLDHVHFHDLRHSTASEMINAGVPLHTVGKVLGHRDPRSTDRYAHLTADTLAAAVGAIGRKSSG